MDALGFAMLRFKLKRHGSRLLRRHDTIVQPRQCNKGRFQEKRDGVRVNNVKSTQQCLKEFQTAFDDGKSSSSLPHQRPAVLEGVPKRRIKTRATLGFPAS